MNTFHEHNFVYYGSEQPLCVSINPVLVYRGMTCSLRSLSLPSSPAYRIT